jgi:hypothetical protein
MGKASFRGLVGVLLVVALGLGAQMACSSGSEDLEGSSSGAGAQSGSANGPSGSLSAGVGGDFSSGPGAGTGGDTPCNEVSEQAKEGALPADIILVVDTSGSMSDEAKWTQNNMNNFAQTIVGSGVDAHVVLIASDDICIPAPLGSGQCPADDKLPEYRHVHVGVGSHNAFQKILDTYTMWKDSLRPGATRTIAVVTDDDSDMSATEFTQKLLALDPSFMGFKFDAIYSYEDPAACEAACFPKLCQGCGKCCPSCKPLSAAKGGVYEQLVSQTMGVKGDLCDQQFDPVFKDMANAVVSGAKLPCVYDIPPAPDGMPYAFDQVNVDYKPTPNDKPQPIYHVPGGEADCGAQGGWYYDNALMPTKILLCPETCKLVQGSDTGEITVKFGCDTLVVPK